MRKVMTFVMLVAVVLTALAASGVAAQKDAMDPAQVAMTLYAAVQANDLDSAGAMLADDAVLVLVPPPPGTDGTFVGKEAVLGWYENLIANNFAIEFSNPEVSGNRFTMTNLTWVDDLPIAPVEFDGTGIVQEGLVKTMSWVITPVSMAELEAAGERMANESLGQRYMDELWIQGNLDVADEILAEDFVSYAFPPGDREVLKQAIAGYHADHPEGSFEVYEQFVTPGRIVLRGAATDVPEGAAVGAQPEPFDEWIVILGVKDGKISERWFGQVPPAE